MDKGVWSDLASSAGRTTSVWVPFGDVFRRDQGPLLRGTPISRSGGAFGTRKVVACRVRQGDTISCIFLDIAVEPLMMTIIESQDWRSIMPEVAGHLVVWPRNIFQAKFVWWCSVQGGILHIDIFCECGFRVEVFCVWRCFAYGGVLLMGDIVGFFPIVGGIYRNDDPLHFWERANIGVDNWPWYHSMLLDQAMVISTLASMKIPTRRTWDWASQQPGRSLIWRRHRGSSKIGSMDSIVLWRRLKHKKFPSRFRIGNDIVVGVDRFGSTMALSSMSSLDPME